MQLPWDHDRHRRCAARGGRRHDRREGAVRHLRSHAADGRHRRKGERGDRRDEGRPPTRRHLHGGRRRECEHSDHRQHSGRKGTIGKLVNDDELYNRTLAIARQGDEIAANAMKVVENARQTLEGFQSKDGPIQGMTANVTQTMSDARAAMAGFAENMEALKHNFLVRGFFKGRGYFNLAHTSPADYRKGVLTKGSDRRVVRLWLPPSDVSFAPEPEHPENERLAGAGKAAIDAAIAPYLEHIAAGLVIVEGYAQQGTRDQQDLRSQARATTVRDYLITKFRFDPEATGAMALGVSSADAAEKAPRDTVALAIILPKAAFAPPPTSSTPARPDTIK